MIFCTYINSLFQFAEFMLLILKFRCSYLLKPIFFLLILKFRGSYLLNPFIELVDTGLVLDTDTQSFTKYHLLSTH